MALKTLVQQNALQKNPNLVRRNIIKHKNLATERQGELVRRVATPLQIPIRPTITIHIIRLHDLYVVERTSFVLHETICGGCGLAAGRWVFLGGGGELVGRLILTVHCYGSEVRSIQKRSFKHHKGNQTLWEGGKENPSLGCGVEHLWLVSVYLCVCACCAMVVFGG